MEILSVCHIIFTVNDWHPDGVVHERFEQRLVSIQARIAICLSEQFNALGMHILIAITRPVPTAGYIRITSKDGSIEVIGVRVVLRPGQATGPDEWSLAIARVINNIWRGKVVDRQCNADLCQILLE